MIPSAILYQPKDAKLWLRTKFIRNLIATTDTTNAVIQPTASINSSSPVKVLPFKKKNISFKNRILV